MQKSLFRSKAIITINLVSVVLVIILIAFMSVRFTSFSETLINEKLIANINSLKLHLDDSKANTRVAAVSMALDPLAIEAIRNSDRKQILEIFTNAMDLYRINNFIICDNEGNVLVRTHEPNHFGDSVLFQQTVQSALTGKVSSYYEAGTIAKVSVRTGAPVYDTDGTLIGVISAGIRFDTKEEVDKLKILFNSEVTVFYGDTRIATTITMNGQRIVGTTLDPQIADVVINNKQEYSGIADILGKQYMTFYKPLLDSQNEVFAVIFLGMPMTEMNMQRNISIAAGIIIGITQLFVLMLLIFRNRYEKRQLEEMLNEMAEKREEAKAASMAKSAFLSTMSHEMRTPLSAITGMTSIGRLATDNDKKNHSFDKIEEASMHLLRIINDILDMSKIEADKMELSIREFDLNDVINKAVSIDNFLLHEKNQKIHVSVDEYIPKRLRGDDQKLTQVIMNLLSNAIKFTPDNGVISLNVQLHHIENKTSDLDNLSDSIYMIHFEISDTGIGINPEQQPNLFNLFEQGDSSMSRKYGGTGLGLAISKRIVEMMGGRIWVESELGKGSTFYFTVQLKQAKSTGSYNKTDINSHENNTEKETINDLSFYKSRRILLVEDVEINREIIMELLKPAEMIIDCAENGLEALQMFSDKPYDYDLIFMDMQMPEMDGLEATRKIRALNTENAKHIPIIAMTANVFSDDVNKCLEAGMNAHIGKPVDIDVVYKMLNKYLK